MRRVTASSAIENRIRRDGFVRIAGADEVGRGCLAGPVVAAAVVLRSGARVSGVADSKAIAAVERDRLFDAIRKAAACWAVAIIDPAEIDRINIHQASLRAMRDAILCLSPMPCFVVVDGFRVPNLPMPQRAVVGGDRKCAAIAAASILAKVTRDRLMRQLHAWDPRYGFDRHKGYATADHLAAVVQHGYSAAHRRSFRPPSLFDTMTD